MQESIKNWYDAHETEVWKLAKEIWDYAEEPLKEYRTCDAVAKFMEKQGFSIKKIQAQNLGGTPNTVIASWGEGKPVIGILGEFDALPGLGQNTVPYYSPKEGPGHGCGHNLMGTGGASGAAALKAAMQKEGLKGKVLFLGCPAEETIQGKVYLARDGYFNNMDLCLAWHPKGDIMDFGEYELNALTSIVFKFTGKTAHAAACPWDGRSALDAAELMSIGSQYLREHIPEHCRIHHVYPRAGEQPNIVPEHAEIYFYIRSRDEYNAELVRRVKLLAEGAALMTETSLKMEMRTSCHGYIYNTALVNYIYEAALKVPLLEHTPEEYAFARELYKNVTGKEAPEDDRKVLPTEIKKPSGKIRYGTGTTDIGEVTHIVPTVHIQGGGAVAGLPGHHWSITAISGMSVGQKAAVYGGKILAQCGYDALVNPKIIEDCWKEFREKIKKPYKCRLV